MALAARLEPGLRWPAFRYYSLGDSGFQYSPTRFYPASTVKLVAAVGALLTLGKHKFTGSAHIRIRHGESLIQRPVYRMIKDAVEHSSNSAYDRLVLVAGFDELNRDHLGPHRGLPDMAIQSAFYGADLRRSPSFRLREGSRSQWFPRRRGRYFNPRCPQDKNCVNLLGLQEVLRRVVLHSELPASDRFGIHLRDIHRLGTYLARHRSRLSDHLQRALGHPVKMWNTVGWVPKYDYLENGLVKDLLTGDRYLIAVSVPMGDKDLHAPRVEQQLGRFGAVVLRALRAAPAQGPPLQPDAGPPVNVRATVSLSGRTLRLRIGVTGADTLRGWLGQRPLPPLRAEPSIGKTRHFVGALPLPSPGRHALVLQPTLRGAPVAYRSLVLEIRQGRPSTQRIKTIIP